LLRSQLADALSQRDKWQAAYDAQRLLVPPPQPQATPAEPQPKPKQTLWQWLNG
jgi:hypothetical protein